jgi:hypothetical protein
VQKFVLIFFIVFYCFVTSQANVPKQLNSVNFNQFTNTNYQLIKLPKTSVLENTLGRHLTLKEKIFLKLYRIFSKKNSKTRDSEEKIERKALWSKRLGIFSLISILIPFLNIFSLPAAIVAIVLGAQVLKKTKHPNYAKTGIICGSIAALILLLIAAATIAILLLFSF